MENKEVQKSLAMEILGDYKQSNMQLEKANKRLFTIIIVILVMLFITVGYLVYTLNDIGTVETTTQEVSDFDSINGDVVNGDNQANENSN